MFYKEKYPFFKSFRYNSLLCNKPTRHSFQTACYRCQAV